MIDFQLLMNSEVKKMDSMLQELHLKEPGGQFYLRRLLLSFLLIMLDSPLERLNLL